MRKPSYKTTTNHKEVGPHLKKPKYELPEDNGKNVHESPVPLKMPHHNYGKGGAPYLNRPKHLKHARPKPVQSTYLKRIPESHQKQPKAQKLAVSLPYYPPPVHTHYEPPPPRQEIKTLVKNPHSQLHQHVSSFSTSKPRDKHTEFYDGGPVPKAKQQDQPNPPSTLVLHASPKYPIRNEEKILLPPEQAANQFKGSPGSMHFQTKENAKPWSSPTTSDLHPQPQTSTHPPEVNLQLFNSFSWAHPPGSVDNHQADFFRETLSQNMFLQIPSENLKQRNKDLMSSYPPPNLVKDKSEPDIGIDELKLDISDVEATKKGTPNPSLNEVQIDPDSFSFRLDKMLRKLSTLKATKPTLATLTKTSPFHEKSKNSSFPVDGVIVQELKNEEEESSQTANMAKEDDDLEYQNKETKERKGHSEGKEVDEAFLEENERENSGDHEDLVAAARLELMIESLSAFRSE